MSTPNKPNLAATYTVGSALSLPKYASPKYDGIRAVGHNGQAFSRNGILIPNKTVQQYFSSHALDGFDGELISGLHDADVFKRSSSVIRSIDGPPDWHFLAFDLMMPNVDFEHRLEALCCKAEDLHANARHKVSVVPQTMLTSMAQLDVFEERCLEDGYEGVMLRNPSALYKHGRATEKSQDLLKVKRFEDSEAVVLGWSPLIDKNGTVRPNTMGSLQVRDVKNGVEFSIGSGFDASERFTYAERPPISQVLTYQFFAQGGYEKPRFPTFKGFRPLADLPA